MNKDPFKVVSALLLFAGLTPWSFPLMVQASVAEVHAQQQSNVCNGLVTDQHGEPIQTLPLGFYLRKSFTREILQNFLRERL